MRGIWLYVTRATAGVCKDAAKTYKVSFLVEFFNKLRRNVLYDHLESFNQKMIVSDNQSSGLSYCNKGLLEEKSVESEPLKYSGEQREDVAELPTWD